MSKPTQQQLKWADMEIGVIIHYLMDIYNPEYKAIKTVGVREHMPASIFAPTKLDTDQWIAAAKSAGAKYAVLVANHCTGFSLWPTRDNDYSIASSPWKDGKGDIVGDFVKSCEKYGLKPGLYYSTGCNGYYGISDADPDTHPGTPRYDEYVKHVNAQLTELWTQYGDMFEIWFDGGTIPKEKGGPDAAGLLEKYQPDAICFQGPKGHAHNVRWVGNELGLSPENCWAATNSDEAAFDGTFNVEEAGVGSPDGKYWWPAENDMGNRRSDAFGGGWAWRAGEQDKVYTSEELLECYLRSVGRNANLLIGMAINRDGEFEDAKQFEDFGRMINEKFGKAKAETSGRGKHIELDLPDGALDYVVIREDITNGHIVRAFTVSIDGKEVYSAKCIGHKRIIKLNGAHGKKLTLDITESAGEPVIRDMGVY